LNIPQCVQGVSNSIACHETIANCHGGRRGAKAGRGNDIGASPEANKVI
jgi:hypothetical protein